MKILDWIDINKIRWSNISLAPNANHLLEQNTDKIIWGIFITKSKCDSFIRTKYR